MNIEFASSKGYPTVPSQDSEIELVQHFVETVQFPDRASIVNFYVAMKSKPMLILPGLIHSDKLPLVRALTHVLIGEDSFQCQMVTGHPWWVGTRGSSALLTTIHTRFVTEKILAVMEEASLPENFERIYIVCLLQINPAELSNCFTEVAYQLSSGEIMRIGDVHFSRPLRYPDNLWLIGTLDEPLESLDDTDLLSQAMILQLPMFKMKVDTQSSSDDQARFQAVFMRSRVRGKQLAYHKLESVLYEHGSTLGPILRVVQYLNSHGLYLPSSVLDNCVLYLANAWSSKGRGLFSPISCRNLEIASDFAIKQMILPRINGYTQFPRSLHLELRNLLNAYPRSLAVLETLRQ